MAIAVAGAVALLLLLPDGRFSLRKAPPTADRNVFALSPADVPAERRRAFKAGLLMFTRHWIVRVPGPDVAFDGLGPLFNQTSCIGCHVHGGRGGPPERADQPMETMVVRLSLPDGESDPRYGAQLNDKAIPGVPAEGRAIVEYDESAGAYGDGSRYDLAAPRYRFFDLAFGPLDDALVSARVPPPMIGLGLLEAVPAEALEAMADPEDSDGDGISGRINWIADSDGYLAPGRFGWKADAPWLRDQAGQAGLEDMGLTNQARPEPNCTAVQTACQAAAVRPRPDMRDDFFADLVTYLQMATVPPPRISSGPEQAKGEALFAAFGCAKCHAPTLRTGAEAALPELRDREFHPYTDLLIHDMGEGLADHRPEGSASGTEWRTPPLWGIGLSMSLNGHERFLHDGRARGLAEAILWHGGEAERAREAFRTAASDDRAALIAFLRSI